ncbi:uncharacterized protein LOC121731440 [Aricia agestis]|uniref:uncharacterized protein LOC121731440 n=1 Tax=Aricia agestis TaxID=91739 RepID=UPI001C209359|nr:uncharacterized protein LOC121731440 [Aricia agestis]
MKKRASVQSNTKSGNTYSQWGFALLANALTMSYGLECGWISPITKMLQSDASPTGGPLTKNEVSLIASSMSMAAVFAVPLYSFISQRYGSKLGVILLAVPQTISWALRIVYSTSTTLLIARILAGIAAGGVFNVVPIYVKEISEDKVRGVLGSLLVLTQNTGVFIMYIMGAYLDYYVVLYISICLPVLTGLLMLKSPDSPAFLVREGKIEEAADSIALLRGLDRDDKLVQLELQTLRKEDDKFKSMPAITFKAMFADKAWRRGYIFIGAIFTFHGLNGAYTIVTYASAILAATGVEMNISPELQTLSIPLVMIISSLILTLIVEICGRKWLLVGSFVVTAISMVTLAAAILILRAGGSVPGWVPILAMIMVVSMYSIGVSPLPYILLTEMFSFQVRNKVSGTIVSYAWFLTFVGVFIYAPITSMFGQYMDFLLHAVVNITGAIFVAIFVPETKGKNDEEIRRILTGTSKEDAMPWQRANIKQGGQHLRYKDVLKRRLNVCAIVGKACYQADILAVYDQYQIKKFEKDRLQTLEEKRQLRKERPKPSYIILTTLLANSTFTACHWSRVLLVAYLDIGATMENGENKGHVYRQVVFALLANCLSFTGGMESGWISPMTKVLQSDTSPTGVALTDDEISWIASSMSIAAVFGVSVYTYIADKYGSKIGVIMVAVPQAIALTLKVAYSSSIVILVARIIFGISSGGIFNVIPLYVKEISQDSMKGILGSFLILMSNIGLFTMFTMGAFLDYHTVLYLVVGLPVLTAFLMLKAPDSPAFLVRQGKIDDAADVLAYLRGLNVDSKMVRNEIDTMIHEEEQFKDLPSIRNILKLKPIRRAIVLIFCLFTFHALNGSFAIVTHASSILKSTGVEFSVRPELQTLGIPLIMIIASSILTSIVERCGRKPLLIGAFFMSTIWMTLLGSIVLVQRMGYRLPSWLPVSSMLLIVAMNAGGLAPLPYVILTEMFSFQVRAKVVGAVVTYAWFQSFVSLAIYTPIANNFGQYTAFFFFGAINLAGGTFVHFFLPETKGKSDEEIRAILAGRPQKQIDVLL